MREKGINLLRPDESVIIHDFIYLPLFVWVDVDGRTECKFIRISLFKDRRRWTRYEDVRARFQREVMPPPEETP